MTNHVHLLLAPGEAITGLGQMMKALAGYGLPDCLRVTIGTEAEMRATAEAIAEVMA